MRLLPDAPAKTKDTKPGDMWYVDWNEINPGLGCHSGWSNCDGRHLVVMLPNGGCVDLHSRASNCVQKDEKTHRCWIIHGTPPHITVDKDGHTCPESAGSIINGDWHGFIRDGKFVEA